MGGLPGSDGNRVLLSESVQSVVAQLIDILESSPAAVVFPADAVLSTQQAADVLGVSRMTVVRLIDRGELASSGGGVHRRLTAGDVARYRKQRERQRSRAVRELAQDVDEGIPPDRVVSTR